VRSTYWVKEAAVSTDIDQFPPSSSSQPSQYGATEREHERNSDAMLDFQCADWVCMVLISLMIAFFGR
jgi:hypothetical protein